MSPWYRTRSQKKVEWVENHRKRAGPVWIVCGRTADIFCRHRGRPQLRLFGRSIKSGGKTYKGPIGKKFVFRNKKVQKCKQKYTDAVNVNQVGNQTSKIVSQKPGKQTCTGRKMVCSGWAEEWFEHVARRRKAERTSKVDEAYSVKRKETKGTLLGVQNSLRKREHQPVLLRDRMGYLQYKTNGIRSAHKDHWNS